MAYDFYLGGLLLPVPPEALTIQSRGRNTTMTLIDDGEVAAIGRHEDLYNTCGAYRHMVDLQKLEEGAEYNA